MRKKKTTGGGFVKSGFAGGAFGVTSFTGLSDVPHSYAGKASNILQVNAGETALEFIPGRSQINGVAALDGAGKVPVAQIPAIAISDFLGSVASQVAMLLLTGEKGDWCIRTDLNTVWIIIANDGHLITDWQQLAYPSDPLKALRAYWENPVLSIFDNTVAIPPAPVIGDRYIALVTAHGWTAKYIYEWGGAAWTQTVPVVGTTLHNIDKNTLITLKAPFGIPFWFNVSYPDGITLGFDALDGGRLYIIDASITDQYIAVANKDGTAITPSMRTIGAGALQACAGNDARLSDSRPPNGAASGDLADNYPSPTVAKASKSFAYTGIITPAVIGADQNDYNPANLSTSVKLRISSSAAYNITGLQGGSAGRKIIITNIGAFNITLLNENAGSAAANRFTFLSDIVLLPNKSVILMYDTTSTRWRSIARSPDPYGTAVNTTCQGNDSRLSDARTPTAHASSHYVAGSDPMSPRTTAVASSATPTPNGDTTDMYVLSALAVNATFGAPTGTPVNGQKLILRIYDNGTQRTLAWNAIYNAAGVTLPTNTTVGSYTYVGLIYNSTSAKWTAVAVNIG